MARFIFSGALIPKQVKRILKMKGLTAVVANDAEGAMVLDDAMNTVGSSSFARISRHVFTISTTTL